MPTPTSNQKFYIVLPSTPSWHTTYPRVIIQGEDNIPGSSLSLIKVLAPQSFAIRWPHVFKRDFIACKGPVRPLSYDSYLIFINKLRPDIPVPKGVSLQENKTAQQKVSELALAPPSHHLHLKNGTTIPFPILQSIIHALATVKTEEPDAFSALVKAVTNKKKVEKYQSLLQQHALVDASGKPYPFVSNTLDSATSQLRSPLARL